MVCRPGAIVVAPGASAIEEFSAREVRRYVWQRTGVWLPIRSDPGRRAAIVIGRKDRSVVADAGLRAEDLAALGPESHRIQTTARAGRTHVVLAGGDDTGVLYAAYRFAELLGVRFYLHGDVLPDERVPLALPALAETNAPLFKLRGIQPFHDFPEGPDWWNREDYLAILSQLPKLRMNFFGLHTYPEGGPNAEPTVWIGPPAGFGTGGRVTAGYPASYQNSLRGNWGYAPKKTSEYAFGAAQLFERDDFGAEVMWGAIPEPASPEACNQVFNRTAALLREAFTHARELGVKTCVGTETPLSVPRQVQERLRARGRDPADPATVREIYRGIFQRIAAAYPLDYYWFWTPEGWTWEGTKDEQARRTINDLLGGIGAAREVNAPFQLATCGWVLGPQQDRALFDKVLPKEVAVSCINREVGKTPVDRGFADVRGRGKWAIPWMEDDPALTSPQLWAGRMRRDAADAHRYGCDGLMGIHWRTRVLGPAVSALAQAAWSQDAWDRAPVAQPPRARQEGAEGGQTADFPNNVIAGTDTPRVYQSVRYNLSGYHLQVPDGACTVTLKFCEPHYTAAGRRVFEVHLQGQRVIERLDIFERVGQNRALDFVYPNVAVRDGWLEIGFVPLAEFPSIAGLTVEGAGWTKKINCGGAGAGGFAADLAMINPPEPFPPVGDFYRDWAEHEFGAAVAKEAAEIFAGVDGRLPRPSDWVDGPGGIRPDARPWAEVAGEYAFVGELAALGPRVQGAGNRERFGYWLETFRYHRTMAQLNCAWAEFNQTFAKVKAGPDAAQRKALAEAQALPARRRLVALAGELYEHLLALVSNPGELGTVMNWEAHNLPGLLTQPGKELADALGRELPADAQPCSAYRGAPRLILPTNRTSLRAGEDFTLKAIVLAAQPATGVALHWRNLGTAAFKAEPLEHVARGVYTLRLPPPGADFEYYVEARFAGAPALVQPASAPRLNRSVVRMGPPSTR